MIQHCIDCDKPFHVEKGDCRTLCPACAEKWISEMEADMTYGDPNPLEEAIKMKANQSGKSLWLPTGRSPDAKAPEPMGEPQVTPTPRKEGEKP